MKKTFLALVAILAVTPASAEFFSAGGHVGGKHPGHHGHQTPTVPVDAYKRPNQGQPFRTLPRDAYGPAPEQTINIKETPGHRKNADKPGHRRNADKPGHRKHAPRGGELRIVR